MNRYIRPLLAIAAVVAIALAGIALLARPSGSTVGGPTALLSPSPAATPVPTLGTTLGSPGATMRAETFSEPFTFTVPAYPFDSPTATRVEGFGGDLSFQSNLWGVVTFHDDTPIYSDLCKPNGTRLDDIPATPDAVGRWLESSPGLDVSAPIQLNVDGRTALRWDVTTSTASGVCDDTANLPAPWFQSGERHRIYAIPTGTDTILAFTYGIDWAGGPVAEAHLDDVNAATDDLVRSMTFDG